MDGYYSAALLARIAAFCEMLCPGAESTEITRDGSTPLDAFECEVFSKRNHFTLTSVGGLVRVYVEPLDSREECPVLLCEVEASSEYAADELRAAVASVELLTAMRERGDFAGIRALRRMISGTLPIRHRH